MGARMRFKGPTVNDLNTLGVQFYRAEAYDLAIVQFEEAVRPLTERAKGAFAGGDTETTVAALEEAILVAGRLDAARRFLHCYVDVFLMRGLALEHTDREVAKAAYRELIALYAEHPLHHPKTLRSVARAREAVERLTPVPLGPGT